MRSADDHIFPRDRMTRRERVLATLRHQPVDRPAILEQLSYNPRVIADWTGRAVRGFDYTADDICAVIRQTLDLAMPPVPPRGTGRATSPDGFVTQNDNWTAWHVSRPFADADGARDWLSAQTAALRATGAAFDPRAARDAYRAQILGLQGRIGGTVILNFSATWFCFVFDRMGLEIFSYFVSDYPEVFAAFLEQAAEGELRRVHAVADAALSPVILIPEDFSTKQGPMFSPEFLGQYLYPHVRRLTAAWHEHGVVALYHSDGNYRKAIPDLIGCGVDGFYCLEPGCGMDIVEFKNAWPNMVWSGGVDGVDLLERGSPEQVRTEVRRQIRATNAVETGGMFVASSSEINPPIPPENFRAMLEAVELEADG